MTVNRSATQETMSTSAAQRHDDGKKTPTWNNTRRKKTANCNDEHSRWKRTLVTHNTTGARKDNTAQRDDGRSRRRRTGHNANRKTVKEARLTHNDSAKPCQTFTSGKRLAKAWQRLGKGSAKAWQRLGKGLAPHGLAKGIGKALANPWQSCGKRLGKRLGEGTSFVVVVCRPRRGFESVCVCGRVGGWVGEARPPASPPARRPKPLPSAQPRRAVAKEDDGRCEGRRGRRRWRENDEDK